MGVFKLKKGEKVRVEIVKARNNERKTQFNVVIDKKLKDRVKKLAKVCRIPVSNFTEHCIEVGMHYIEQTLSDEKKREILEGHLETKHLLDKKTDDEEYVIRLCENNVNWLLIEGVERALDKMQLLTRQVWAAGKDGNLKSMAQIQSDLYREMVTFLNWITKLKDYEKYRV
jgi:hypothetical protein